MDVKLACEDGRELTAPVARQTMHQPAQRGKEQADSLLTTHPAPQAKHTMQAESEQRGDQVRDSSGPRKFRSSVVCNGPLCPTLTALFLPLAKSSQTADRRHTLPALWWSQAQIRSLSLFTLCPPRYAILSTLAVSLLACLQPIIFETSAVPDPLSGSIQAL